MKDEELQWFRPLWLRLLVTALVLVWFLWETFFNKDQLWMLITAAALAYAVWNLFIKFNDKIGKADSKLPPPGENDGQPKA
jgi:hypothetical protein